MCVCVCVWAGEGAERLGCGEVAMSVSCCLLCRPRAEFITQWNLGDTLSLELPLFERGEYEFAIGWGDGQFEVIRTGQAKHIYEKGGTYLVRIMGTLRGFCFREFRPAGLRRRVNGGSILLSGKRQVDQPRDRRKLVDVVQWGCVRFETPQTVQDRLEEVRDASDTRAYPVEATGCYFYGCTEMTMSAPDAPDLRGVQSLAKCFYDCQNLVGDVSGWAVRGITNMQSMFEGATRFAGDVSSWQTANLQNVDFMFCEATNFAGDCSLWRLRPRQPDNAVAYYSVLACVHLLRR